MYRRDHNNIKKVLKQAALFEENCKRGNVSTEKQTFEEYARYVLDLKEHTGAKHKITLLILLM